MEPPKKIIKTLETYGNEFAKVERSLIKMGGEEVEWCHATLPSGTHILPILGDGNILLTRQYRLFNRGWVYEVPGGIIDEGEAPEETARRELEEETGYKAGKLEKLLSFLVSPVMPTRSTLFVATELEKGEQKLDKGEFELTTREFTPQELWEMVHDGTIQDSHTIVATLLAKERGFLKID